MENKIQRNAVAFQKLLSTEYYICLAHKGIGYEIRIRFSINDFHHLEGLGQLKDLAIHRMRTEETFDMALNGQIDVKDLAKSDFYVVNKIPRKIECLHMLETVLDCNELVFKLVKNSRVRTKIDAEYFLVTHIGCDYHFFVYIDKTDISENIYYCKSLVVNPEDDRLSGNVNMSLLWKEKINLITNETEIQFHYKDFTPNKLSKPNDIKKYIDKYRDKNNITYLT